MFYLLDLKKMAVKSAWADVDSAEAAANRMRNESYVCDLEGFESFKMAEVLQFIDSVGGLGEYATPRTKADAVGILGNLLSGIDWAEKVVKRPGGPRVKGAVAMVHEICDSMPDAPRRDVLAACVEAGINPSTASTQYQRWRTLQG